MIAPTICAVAAAGILWLGLKALSWIEYNRGRMAGMAEADRRNRAQQRHDYDRGRTDAIREGILTEREEQP